MAELTDLIQRFTTLDEAACEVKAVALGQQGEEGLSSLKLLLAADQEDARFWAVRGLWANASPEAVSLLIDMLSDEVEMVRSGAAFALGELKAEEAVGPLLHLLINDASDSGHYAADALAKIGQPAAQGLIEALKHSQAWIRVRAAKTLGTIKNRQAIGPLFYALEDESYLVRHYAEIALERMGIGQMVYFKP